MIVDNFLKRKRLLSGFSKKGLSDASGVSVNTIVSIEGNKTNPSLESLHWLSKALDCDIGDLVSSGCGNDPYFIDTKKVCREEGVKFEDLITTGEFNAVYRPHLIQGGRVA